MNLRHTSLHYDQLAPTGIASCIALIPALNLAAVAEAPSEASSVGLASIRLVVGWGLAEWAFSQPMKETGGEMLEEAWTNARLQRRLDCLWLL